MEFPHIDNHCSAFNCKQLDFLPLTCKCGSNFCSEHFNQHTVKCCSEQSKTISESNNVIYVCSYLGCQSKSYIPLLCTKCHQHLCVTHRHIIECIAKSPETVATEIEKFNAPIKQFESVKKSIDKQLEKNIEQARKKDKKRQLALQLQLMCLKGKATGSLGIPPSDRIYFNVQQPLSIGSQKFPVFISKTWSLGKTIDAIATELKLINRNNQANAKKLRLFLKSNSNALSLSLESKIEQLLSEGIINNGEELILEYVADNCGKLE